MVYMSGTGRAARASSITNRPTCGGVKKAGLSPRTGYVLTSNINKLRMHNTQWVNGMPPSCVVLNNHPTQRIGYRAVHTPI